MRRFLTLVCLLGLALPAGISISGCVRNPAGNYCNGLGYGLKDTDVASITLQPQISGISLAYGQTAPVSLPSAFTCKGAAATVNTNAYVYGTTNNQLADISPKGQLCAGTWNRNTGGGIADYTYCNFPNPLPSTGKLPYAVAYITATANSVTSNPVAVYVHAPVTAISLVTTSLSSSSPQQCFSQNHQAELDAEACYTVTDNQGLTHQYEFCAPASVASSGKYACTEGVQSGVASVPTCGSSIGTLSFSVSDSTVASISPGTLTNPLSTITAQQPGTTAITANIAQSGSSAGYFSTCPPASITVKLANGAYSGVVTQGVTQNLNTLVYDTQGVQINGLSLSYESTNPIDITAASGGSISAAFPGVASVYAVCQPPSCNPAPINEFGLNGTGLPLSSNPVSITVPGTTSDYVWFAAPGQSQYLASMQLLTGNPGSTVRLPYVPNSMVMDQGGADLYFGSLHELMIYSTATNTISKQDPGAPGVVLAVSPNNASLIINDQLRGLFYLYGAAGGAASTFAGMGVAAAWTPDSNTLYIVDSAAANSLPQNIAAGITSHTNTLYVYNANTGWSTYNLDASGGSESVAVTVPGVAAYLAGNPTVAHAWCPTGTVGNNASIQFYPQSDTLNSIATSVLASTNDGQHILGAALYGSSITLDDIGVNIPANPLCPEQTTGAPPNQVQTMGQPLPFSTNPTIDRTVTLGTATGATMLNATAVNQIVTGAAPATASVAIAAPIAFITYNGATAGNQLPYYLPQATTPTSVGYVTLKDSNIVNPPTLPPAQYPSPTAPLAGAFSPDNSIFFVSTAGDNAIHFIGIPANVSTALPPVDTQQYLPNLPACTPGTDPNCVFNSTNPAPASGIVPATVITVKPRSVT